MIKIHILILSFFFFLPQIFNKKKNQLEDDPDSDLYSQLGNIVKVIDEYRGMDKGVLVHCRAGASRSVAVVVAYLMKKEKLTVDEALMKVKSIRGERAQPNEGFMQQLKKFE